MRRRRRIRQSGIPGQNLDSFLDILTNTVGVLMFVGLFISIVAVESGTIVRTPIVSETRKNAHFFEFRNNRIYFIDKQEAEREINQFFQSLPQCYEPYVPPAVDPAIVPYYLDLIEEYRRCLNAKTARVEQFSAETPAYEVRIKLNPNGLIYLPKPEFSGETPQELRSPDSRFKQTLKQFDPKTDYLAFIVRPDSFEAFRAARKQAWNDGFDVGWEPLEPDSIIVFGSGGRAIGVQ
ncbi:hypothetical protein JJD41_01150 [Oxynema sp. CENA135]|uniref:hypothetical protein n=1 Tax=Oxynema sp. CENA135 TaxID=984206 RepID=UPI00190A6055|nr:hypothetical protein [Oxynema sp. CENA135]MBK4728501.1 hypothetical protein [Oxynema sp. CENA135]